MQDDNGQMELMIFALNIVNNVRIFFIKTFSVVCLTLNTFILNRLKFPEKTWSTFKTKISLQKNYIGHLTVITAM